VRLTDLEPQFIALDRNEAGRRIYRHVDSIDAADGLLFLCPTCFEINLRDRGDGTIGTHAIICWRPRIAPEEAVSGPGRWELVGTGYADLSLVGQPSSSVLLQGGCNAHFFVQNGEIVQA